MKNSKRIILRAIPVLFMLVAMVFVAGGNVFGDAIDPNLPNTGNDKITGVTNLAGTIWNTVAVILQILAIAAIVLAGVRYMFASADAKADIKKQTVILVIGAVLVFGAVAIAQLIANSTGEALGTGKNQISINTIINA